MHVTIGMILVPGLNDGHLAEFLPWLLARGVRDMHLRSVGQMGRYMENCSLSLDQLEARLRAALGPRESEAELVREEGSSRDFRLGRCTIQLTEWPELGSLDRGRIAPDGWLEPMFESIIANEHRY
jgi:hypothetical protein